MLDCFLNQLPQKPPAGGKLTKCIVQALVVAPDVLAEIEVQVAGGLLTSEFEE